MNKDLHQMQVTVWVFCSVGCEFNQPLHSSRNNVEGSQSEAAPDRTTRYGDHLEGGDNAKVITSAFENAEQAYGELEVVAFQELKAKGRSLAEKRHETER